MIKKGVSQMVAKVLAERAYEQIKKDHKSKSDRYNGIQPRMLYDEKPGDCFVYKSQGQPVTVMQFTGLVDKNGKEIYEGDILNFENKFTYDVRYEDAKFVCHHVKGNGWGKWGDLHRFFDPDFLVYGGVEVIGNIYEHPELLSSKA
jgi:uncharacterized phage protein (TIGR01671 family)